MRLCAIACLSVLLLIGFSCIQEDDVQISEKQEFSPEIQKVKSWYEKNKVLLHPKPGSAHAREFSHDLILPFFEKEPDWEDFYSYQFPDGRQVFEVHVKNLTGIMPTTFMEKYGSQANDLTEESLLFIENPQVPDGFIPVVARYFSEGQQSEGMTYHQIPLGWTGRIDLLTYDERHLRSIKVENGQLISHIRYQTEEPRVSSRAYSSYTYCHPGYWVDFPYYAMEEEIGVESQQSVWVQECYTNTYETEEPGTSSPQVGGGGTSSPPPSSTTPEEEDICEEEFCIPFPEELLDPDQKREAQLGYLNTHGASEFVSMIREMMTTPGLTMGDWAEINRLVNQIYLQQRGKFMMAIFSPENLATLLSFGLYNNAISTSVRQAFFKVLAKYATKNVGRGFNTFQAFKNAFGSAGPGKQWHHIVSQRASNISKFGADKIHNSKNLVKIKGGFSGSFHSRITAFYNSKSPMGINTGGKTFGEWVSQKSFQDQMLWGLKVMDLVK